MFHAKTRVSANRYLAPDLREDVAEIAALQSLDFGSLPAQIVLIPAQFRQLVTASRPIASFDRGFVAATF